MVQTDERRDSIIYAARDVFSKYGLKKTSMEDIADNANISKGTIYNYFENKEELFNIVVENELNDFLTGIKAAIGKADTAEQKLAVYVNKRMSIIRNYNNLHRILCGAVDDSYPSLERLRRNSIKNEWLIINKILSDGIDDGEFRNTKASLMATMLVQALLALEEQWVGSSKNRNIDQEIAVFIDLIFNGLKSS